MIYLMIKRKFRLHEITAAGVWECADKGTITPAQALSICGPRPKEKDGEE